MDILKTVGVDPARETQGRWFEWVMGVKLLIARYNNENYQARERALLREALEESGKQPDGVLLSQKQVREIQNRCLAETVLLGWQGFDEFDGIKPFDYSPENAYTLLSDPRMSVLRSYVVNESQTLSNYAWTGEQKVVAALKNA